MKISFPELVRRGGKLTTNIGLKMRVPVITRDRVFKKRLREEFMKDNPYAALDRLCYQDSLLDYGELEEEISEGRARRVKQRIRRRFARCKTTLIKIDYQAKTIRITLRPGKYLTISWRSTWFEHRVRGWAVGEAISSTIEWLSLQSSKEIYVRRVIGWDSN